jgi:RND family efflux transporter MFP subunit
MKSPLTFFCLLFCCLPAANVHAQALPVREASDVDTFAIAESEPDGEFECLLEPHIVVSVSSPVGGILKTVSVDRGDFVKQGQVLARLESGVEEAAQDLARAKAEFGKRQADRSDELYKEKFISINAKDEMATNTLLAKLEYKQAREMMARRVIKSPIKGLVVERTKAAGEYVENEQIVKLAQIDPLNVEVVIPVSMYGAVKKGMQAKVYPEAPVGGEYTAKITIVDRVIDAASGTIGVRLELPNPDSAIPAGLKCRLKFMN